VGEKLSALFLYVFKVFLLTKGFFFGKFPLNLYEVVLISFADRYTTYNFKKRFVTSVGVVFHLVKELLFSASVL